MGNPLDKYTRKHGAAYPFRTRDHFPDTLLTVRFHRGYVHLHHPRQGDFYITRNAWIRLLRFSLPIVKYMDRQFSVLRAVSRYMREEDELRRDLRAQKIQRYGRRRRARRRH